MTGVLNIIPLITRVTPLLLWAPRLEGHRGDVPSRPHVLSGVTPFTLTGSGSAYRSE